MSVINILDENTIDKIAAGEVVERPASVVKELVENAIDSGATAITVEIKDGGISMIRVTDNGQGIEKDQIKKAFMRHATSKITSVTDLFRISSLGFRGEALSSICAVSQVELLTKTKDDYSGSRYIINGGKEEAIEDAGVPNGTTIIVRNLFYNTPARKKFLKSSNTEAGYISELMEKFILSHPDIAIKYMVNGIDKMTSSGNGDIKSAIYSVFGKVTVESMIPLEYLGEEFSVTGYICKPEICRGNRNYEFFFVNERIIKSKILSNSIEEAYKNYLMLHKYPFVVLYFDIEPTRLDINVHPAKTEIKFLDEAYITATLLYLVQNALSKKELIPEVVAEKKSESNREITHKINSPEPFEDKRKGNSNYSSNINNSVAKEATFEFESTTAVSHSYQNEFNKDKPQNFESENTESKTEQLSIFSDDFLSESAAVSHRIIGQLFDTYWLVEYNEKLYIIDQHAAHEKVLYERIIKRLKAGLNPSQIISPPEIVSLSVSEEEALCKYKENLNTLGFEWEHFGGREYSICAVPCDLFGMGKNDYFISILDELSVGRKPSLDTVNDRIATMACKAAVKANMRLSTNEAKALIDELMTLDNPYNCPHGRPVIISYSKTEIEKLFKRIV